ncbi:MAG: hypothetical protein IJK23_12990 [Clostridia bacterium]|nr:hypothetical protein [Clostridia bacterium]
MTTFTKRTSGKLLAVFLAALMIVTSVSVSFTAVAAGEGSVSDAQWNTLAAALRSDNVAGATFNGTNSVTVEDPSGDVYTAAKAYYAVLNAYIFKATGSSGSENESKYGYRTSSQVRDLVKTKMQSVMGSDYNTYNVSSVLQYLGGNVTVSGNTNTTQSQVPTTTVTVTVTRSSNLMSCATLADAATMPTYKYTISHTNTRKYKPSGCGAKDTYYCTCSGTSETTGTVNYDISLLTAYQTALNNNAELLSADQAGQIARGYDALVAAYNAITTAKTNAVNKFGATVVAHFFSTYEDSIDALEAAMRIAQYAPIVDRILENVETDINDFGLAELTTLYQSLKADYDSYKAINIDEVYAYFETDNAILDRAAVDAKYAEIQDAYERAYLRENVQPAIEAAVTDYSAYDSDWVIDTDNADVAINAALTAMNGYKDTLAGYKASNVDAVFGEGYVAQTIDPLIGALTDLLTLHEFKARFAEYQSVYAAAFAPVTLDSSTEQLYAVLSARDAWYTSLKNFVAELTAFDEVLAGKILGELEAQMEAKIDSVYATLNARLEARINTAYEQYQAFVAEYGYTIDTSDDVSVQNYTALQNVFAQLNPVHYDFLAASPNFDIPAETVARYEAVRNAIFAFRNFDATKGLSAYQYNKEDITDILRLVSTADIARNKDFTVDAEKRTEVYDKIKGLLVSDQLKELLGFDFATIGQTVQDAIFTDDFINTILTFLYPLIATEFAKVWADLPASVVTRQNLPLVGDKDITINLSLFNMKDALGAVGLQLLPQLLANNVNARFPDVAAKLRQVSSITTYNKTTEEITVDSWKDPAIYDSETEKLTLEWGVTGIEDPAEKRAKFIDAMSDALSGVGPLLLALLANRRFATDGARIGTGSGKVSVIVTVNITVDPIKLFLEFDANPGYNNALAPILSALGAENVPNGNSFTTVRQLLVNGIMEPIEGVLDQLAGNPLDFILNVLPNLAYALNFGLVEPLLNELKTVIQYHADAVYTTDCSAQPGGNMDNAMVGDPMPINVGEMLDLGSMGIDISSAEGLINSLIGLLSKDEEAEEADPEPADPEAGEGEAEEESSVDIGAILGLFDINDLFQKLAYIGNDVTWKPGHRTVSPFAMEGHTADFPYILVNHPDAFMWIVQYLLDQIGAKEDLLPSLIAAVSGEETELPEIVQTIIDNAVANQDDAIAAVVELIVSQRYEMPAGIDWITEGNIGATDYAQYWTEGNEELTKTHWTREKALYMSEHLETIINYVIAALRDNIGGARTMGEALDYLIGTFFTAETANNLAATLKGALGGLELPDILAKMDLFGQLGIDLTVWDEMVFDFEDGDREAFKNALIEVLNPLAPALGLLLAEQNVSINLLGDLSVTALGYDGYSYGIVPLLEALGCTDLKTTEEFIADPENVVKNLIDPIFSLLDKIIADPMAFIDEVIPSLIYFDKVGGVQVAFEHLLFAVNVVLDTIRPIYDVNLNMLMRDGLGVDPAELASDPLKFIMGKVSGLIAEKAGVNLVIDFSLDTLAESVHFTDPVKFTSANGDDAYTIKLSGDGKAELLVRILDYVIKQVIFEDNYDLIAGLIADNIADDGVREIIDQILGNVVKNYPESILAAVHLLFPERVEMTARRIDWITEGNIGAKDDWMGVNKNLAADETSLWTKDKAEYMAKHLGDFADDVVVIFGEQLGGAENLGEAVDSILKDVFTAANANKIAEGLKNFISNLGLPEVLIDLGIFEQLGLDLHAWDDMSFSFEDGDKDAFKSALITAVKPIEPLLRFLLVEGGDLEFTILDAIPLRALGYDGYSYGIVPLLEALGCTGIKTTKQFKADKTHVVENIVNPLFTAVDHLVDDPLAFIEKVIPALVYFDKVEGIQVAIENILFSVNVILETIKPVYELDLYDLIGEKAGVDLRFAETDPVDFLLAKVAELIESRTGIELQIDFTVESLSETLHFSKPKKFKSKNGDPAYTITLTEQGKADLLSRVLDYAVEQVIFDDNSDNLAKIFGNMIEDDDTRAFVLTILELIKESDRDSEDLHGLHDVFLSELFWIFFGADTVTDAVSDFFYRYKDESFYEAVVRAAAKAPDYADRVMFAMDEIYSVEYPAIMEIAEDFPSYLKNPLSYDDHQMDVFAGIIHRILVFIQALFNLFRAKSA